MPKTHTIEISPSALDVLNRSEVRKALNGAEDFSLTLPANLERRLYVEVNTVLGALGGKWNRGRQAHVFPTDPRDAIASAIDDGSIVDEKKTLQAFFSPVDVANRLVQLATEYATGRLHFYLEPSAGGGAIVEAIRRFDDGAEITAIEVHRPYADTLKLAGDCSTVLCEDFLSSDPDVVGLHDAVILNPPFAGGQDVAHVIHAWDFVEPGGILVAVVSPAFRFRQTGENFGRFRAMNQEYGVAEEELPAGSFKESGTNVASVVVVWVKP